MKFKDQVIKDMQTIMIGALDKFEQQFSHLWGGRKPFNELNPQQRKFRKMWNRARNQILDLGNDKINKIDPMYQNVKDDKVILPIMNRRKDYE